MAGQWIKAIIWELPCVPVPESDMDGTQWACHEVGLFKHYRNTDRKKGCGKYWEILPSSARGKVVQFAVCD